MLDKEKKITKEDLASTYQKCVLINIVNVRAFVEFANHKDASEALSIKPRNFENAKVARAYQPKIQTRNSQSSSQSASNVHLVSGAFPSPEAASSSIVEIETVEKESPTGIEDGSCFVESETQDNAFVEEETLAKM